MELDFNSEKPIFQQIAEGLEDGILSGAFPEEGQIPSITEFSVLYKINPATALKGINLLVEEGVVYKKRGVEGRFLRPLCGQPGGGGQAAGHWQGGAGGSHCPGLCPGGEGGFMSIVIENVSKRFGPVQALQRVSFTLEEGKIYGLLGRNGAGKSTLLSAVTQRLFPDEGRVTVDGESIDGNDRALSKMYLMSEKLYYQRT